MNLPHRTFTSDASSTVIGHILMVALTVLIAGVVALQAVRFMDALDFSGTGFGRDGDEIDVAYSMVMIDENLTITIEAISERIDINRVNYQFYNLSLKRNEADGYLIDIEGSNQTWIRYSDRDSDGHFSAEDMFIIHMGNGILENEYILRLSHNRHPDVVYEISIREEDIRRI